MELVQKYLSEYDYNEIHGIVVNGNCEKCYQTVMNLDLSKSSIIAVLFFLRGLPFSQPRFLEFTKSMNFTLLEEAPYTGFIYGFWGKEFKAQVVRDVNEFVNTTKDYQAKVVWSFQFKQIKEHECKVITETRVKCLTRRARILFSLYWFFIQPFSALIRMEMLKLVKKGVIKGNA